MKASFLWFVNRGAISKKEYAKVLDIIKLRNRYAHKLPGVIFEGVKDEETLLFPI